MRAIELLRELHDFCQFQTRERGTGKASNSELVRWLNIGAVEINGGKVRPNTEIRFPVESMVLFPGGRRVTLR